MIGEMKTFASPTKRLKGVSSFRGRSNSVFSPSKQHIKFDALKQGVKTVDQIPYHQTQLPPSLTTFDTTRPQQGKDSRKRSSKLQSRKSRSNSSALRVELGHTRKNLYTKTMACILKNYMKEITKGEIVDPSIVHDLPFKTLLLPKHNTKRYDYVYKAYSVVLNERIGEFDTNKLHVWLDEQDTDVPRTDYNLFIDELLEMDECCSFLDEFWRIICSNGGGGVHNNGGTGTGTRTGSESGGNAGNAGNAGSSGSSTGASLVAKKIPVGGRLPLATTYSSFLFFHDSLGDAFPQSRGTDKRNAERDWLDNTTLAVPEGWSTENDESNYEAKTNGAAQKSMSVGEGGLEWLKSSFERQLLLFVVEILCQSTRNAMRILKGLRSLFEHLFPTLKIEIKRKEHNRKQSITLVDRPELNKQTTQQRSFGKENFIIVGVAKDEEANDDNSPHSRKRNSNRLSIHGKKSDREPTKTLVRTDSMVTRQRRRSSSRRQSMFGAFLFDFVVRQQTESEQNKGQTQMMRRNRPHLASVVDLDTEQIVSPGNSDGEEDVGKEELMVYNADIGVEDNHYDTRKSSPQNTTASAPNSPNLQLRTRRSRKTLTSAGPSGPPAGNLRSRNRNSDNLTHFKAMNRASSMKSLKKPRRSSMVMLSSSGLGGASSRNGSFGSKSNPFIDELRQQFDPSGEGAKHNSKHYTDKALLQREALRFDKDVLHELNRIWKLVDTGKTMSFWCVGLLLGCCWVVV
jgi:hypothetical protein